MGMTSCSRPKSDVRGPRSARARAGDVQPARRHRRRRADDLRVRTRQPCACACSTPTAARRKCRATASAAWPRWPCASARARRVLTIDTPAGQKVLELQGQDGDALTFRASMGMPQDIRPIEFQAAGEQRASRRAVGRKSSMRAARRSARSSRDSTRWGPPSNTIRNSPTARMSRSQESKRPIACAS